MMNAPLSAVGQKPERGDKQRLRLWIRLLRTTRIVEGELRERLKREFDTTLPRFDVMSALYRRPEGMLMSDLSRFLLVSNGNVTGIVDRLVSDGFVMRTKKEGDKRTSVVRLTPAGVALFEKMAAAHERWITELLGSIETAEVHRLSEMLRAFRSNWEIDH
ncbi:MarR family winged helix-turn-helix transcriptional regulator [Chelativorans intermedius]|uniref:MarR family winged helix-turn-helix transcriptional regulator n=1 Tax=Chelativorans intermedius TaxID=515947 RepID=A0ABV6D5X9_9HYPH|nr:MarR family transcriptional regulator [Chelativorans intermedius]MCT8997480.1 MarR family transcriptional regulator [Chelativorans intermedius]